MDKKPPDTLNDEELKVIRDTSKDSRALWIFAAVTLVIIGVIVYLIFFQRPSAEDRPREKTRISDSAPGVTAPAEGATEETVETPTAEESAVPPPPVSLRESDEYFREQLGEYLDHPPVRLFFAREGVVRRLVAIVTNIAAGESPAPLLDFIPFSRPFTVITEGDRIRVSERAYARYDELVDTFVAPDPAELVNLYLAAEDLFNRAYRDLGRSDQPFRNVLRRALDEVLEVPVVFDPIYLERGVLSYEYARPDLRGLTDAQQHFLRLGPLNLRRVQKQVREIRDLLTGGGAGNPGDS